MKDLVLFPTAKNVYLNEENSAYRNDDLSFILHCRQQSQPLATQPPVAVRSCQWFLSAHCGGSDGNMYPCIIIPFVALSVPSLSQANSSLRPIQVSRVAVYHVSYDKTLLIQNEYTRRHTNQQQKCGVPPLSRHPQGHREILPPSPIVDAYCDCSTCRPDAKASFHPHVSSLGVFRYVEVKITLFYIRHEPCTDRFTFISMVPPPCHHRYH